jgi:hypothetical protein
MAGLQASMLVENLLRVANGEIAAGELIAVEEDAEQGPSFMSFPNSVFHAPPPLICAISLGRDHGAVIFNQLWFTGTIATWVKSFIEWSKVREYKRWWSMEAMWEVADTCAIWSNWAYKKVEGCFGSDKEKKD